MNRITRWICTLAPLVLLDASSLALSGNGFNPGDLVFYGPNVTGTGPGSGGILRIDPLSGATTMIVDLEKSGPWPGSACYDPFRDRVLFMGSLPATPQHYDFYTVDGNGNIQDLNVPVPLVTYYGLTAGEGGRVYFVDNNAGGGQRLRYLDAANAVRTVLDSSGANPYIDPDVNAATCMIFDAGTNALFYAVYSNSGAVCAGAPASDIGIHRLTLSSDGARVVGVDSCAHFTVDAHSSCEPMNWSRGPNGSLALVVDTNSNDSLPRMLLVDPATLSISVFATNGNYIGAALLTAGAYSSVMGRMVIVDLPGSQPPVFDTFGFGQSGLGSVFATTIGPGGGTATLMEIPAGACANSVGYYCTAKTSSSGCVPQLSTTGNPSASAGSGFVLQATQVEANKPGLFFYSLNGAAGLPFQGGFLCVKPPTKRLNPLNSGGSSACGGNYAFDFAAFVASGADPALVASATVNAQAWFRDPADPTSGTGLTGGVVFTLCP